MIWVASGIEKSKATLEYWPVYDSSLESTVSAWPSALPNLQQSAHHVLRFFNMSHFPPDSNTSPRSQHTPAEYWTDYPMQAGTRKRAANRKKRQAQLMDISDMWNVLDQCGMINYVVAVRDRRRPETWLGLSRVGHVPLASECLRLCFDWRLGRSGRWRVPKGARLVFTAGWEWESCAWMWRNMRL